MVLNSLLQSGQGSLGFDFTFGFVGSYSSSSWCLLLSCFLFLCFLLLSGSSCEGGISTVGLFFSGSVDLFRDISLKADVLVVLVVGRYLVVSVGCVLFCRLTILKVGVSGTVFAGVMVGAVWSIQEFVLDNMSSMILATS